MRPKNLTIFALYIPRWIGLTLRTIICQLGELGWTGLTTDWVLTLSRSVRASTSLLWAKLAIIRMITATITTILTTNSPDLQLISVFT